MDILGIGPLELALIAIIILLVLGPKEMVSALRTIGRVLRSIVTSDWWQTTRQAIQDVRKLPYDLMREAGMEEDLQALDEIRQTASGKTKKPGKPAAKTREPDYSAWTQPPDSDTENQESGANDIPALQEEPRILPPGSPDQPGSEQSQADGPDGEGENENPNE